MPTPLMLTAKRGEASAIVSHGREGGERRTRAGCRGRPRQGGGRRTRRVFLAGFNALTGGFNQLTIRSYQDLPAGCSDLQNILTVEEEAMSGVEGRVSP